MKKLVSLLLIMVYSFAMAGTTIAMHYCMGEKVNTTMGYSEQAICEFCHMEKHTGDDFSHCCKDENQFLKVIIDQDLSSFAQAPQTPVLFISPRIFSNNFPLCNRDKSPIYGEQIDPPDIPVYQRNCNFRI